MEIIRDNQQNIDQYQSIYDIHEFAISLFLRVCEEHGLKDKFTLEYVCKDLDAYSPPAIE